MQIPKQIDPDKADVIKKLLRVFSLSIALLDNATDRNARYIKGGLTETIIWNIILLTYSGNVTWQMEKTESQMYKGPDGISDMGWDMEADSLKIDVKWDSKLATGNVCLGLYRSYGHPQLLLSGNATTSAQVYLYRRELTSVQRALNAKAVAAGKRQIPEFTLKVLWIDLSKLRADLTQINGKCSIAEYKEELMWTGDRTLTLPVAFVNGRYGRLDTIEC